MEKTFRGRFSELALMAFSDLPRNHYLYVEKLATHATENAAYRICHKICFHRHSLFILTRTIDPAGNFILTVVAVI